MMPSSTWVSELGSLGLGIVIMFVAIFSFRWIIAWVYARQQNMITSTTRPELAAELAARADELFELAKAHKRLFSYNEYVEIGEIVNRLHALRALVGRNQSRETTTNQPPLGHDPEPGGGSD
jgi:hypothetical protein